MAAFFKGVSKSPLPRLRTVVRDQRLLAFSLIDLLAVLATLALGICFFTPTLAKTRPGGQSIQCLANTKRLLAAWQMYAGDHDDNIVPPTTAGNPVGEPGFGTTWVEGWLDWTLSSDNTNTDLLLDARYSRLAPYVGQNAEIFHCPSDFVLAAAQQRWVGHTGQEVTRRTPPYGTFLPLEGVVRFIKKSAKLRNSTSRAQPRLGYSWKSIRGASMRARFSARGKPPGLMCRQRATTARQLFHSPMVMLKCTCGVVRWRICGART